jgi:LPS sulfotransferase NodH
MKPLEEMLPRRVRSQLRSITGISRIRPLPPGKRQAIPEADFVSEQFDRDVDTPPSRMIVVLSTPRSGSTLLCQLLDRVGLCTAHEYFQHEEYIPLLAYRWNCVDKGQVDWQRYARALERRRTSDQGVLGLKLHGTHLHYFLEALPHFSAGEREFVWLQRRDKLQQAVSFGIARQTNQWSSEFAKQAEARYDFEYFHKRLKMIHFQEDIIRAFLALRSLPHRLVYYEDVVERPEAILHDVFGVATDKALTAGGRGLRKQGNSRNEEFVRQLAEEIFQRAR